MVCVGRDITEFRHLQDRQRELRERLVRAERMESVAVLAGGVAHDLNNILTPIVALPGLVTRNLARMLEAEEEEATRIFGDLEAIQHSGQQAVAVIRDLLTLSRQRTLVLRPILLNDVVRVYLGSAGFQDLEDHNPNVTVGAELAEDLHAVAGSHTHVYQAVMNLVTNAFEAMPHGGRLLIATANRRLDNTLIGHEVVEPGEYALLHVRDTGAGIAEQHLERIFEPFYTHKKMGQRSGSGLGLAVVHGVIKDHCGFVDVHSVVGQGTDMMLYFPVCREGSDRTPVEQEPCQGTGSLLVVDDSEQQRCLAKRLLTALGYQVDTVENGHAAVDRFRQFRQSERTARRTPYDLVLLDMILEEGFDGLDTYREIAALCPEQKCILVSGFAQGQRVAAAMEAGVRQFLAKPYTMEQISRVIRTELRDSEPSATPSGQRATCAASEAKTPSSGSTCA